jgi:hypothetical protein
VFSTHSITEQISLTPGMLRYSAVITIVVCINNMNQMTCAWDFMLADQFYRLSTDQLSTDQLSTDSTLQTVYRSTVYRSTVYRSTVYRFNSTNSIECLQDVYRQPRQHYINYTELLHRRVSCRIAKGLGVWRGLHYRRRRRALLNKNSLTSRSVTLVVIAVIPTRSL